MDFRLKLILTPIPFIIAGYVGISLLQPAIDEANTKETALEEKRNEKTAKEQTLASAATFSKKKIELNEAIEKLRGSVPKAPDIDLLTIDLERMCKDAGMSMVAIQQPKEGGGSSQMAEPSTYMKGQDKLRNAIKSGTGAAGAAAAGGGTQGGGGAAAGAGAEPVGPELEKTSRQFIVTGDFNGLEKLVHLLETYQRVVKIDDIAFRIPKKPTAKDKVVIDDALPAEGEETGDPRLLYVTMTLSTYFLP